MSNPIVVTVLERVTHEPHYRPTIDIVGVGTEVFLELASAWQVGHDHQFSSLTREGTGLCYGCGVTAWSESWIAEDYYGEGVTHLWADELYRSMMAREEADREDFKRLCDLAAELNSQFGIVKERNTQARTPVIVAVLDADEPAIPLVPARI